MYGCMDYGGIWERIDGYGVYVGGIYRWKYMYCEIRKCRSSSYTAVMVEVIRQNREFRNSESFLKQ